MRLAFVAGLPLTLAVACAAFTATAPDTTITDAGASSDAALTIPDDAGIAADASVGPCAVPNVYCNDFEAPTSLADTRLHQLDGFNGKTSLVASAGPSGGQVVQAMLAQAVGELQSTTVAAYSVTAAAGLTFEADLQVMASGNSFPVFVLGIRDTSGNGARLAIDQGENFYVDVIGADGLSEQSMRYPATISSAWVHVVIHGSTFTVGPVGGGGEAIVATMPTFDPNVEYFFGADTEGNVNGYCQVDVDWVRLTQ